MNVTADATTPRGLGTFAFDDEGVPARREPIVQAGVLVGFLTLARDGRAARPDPAGRCARTAGAACHSCG